MALLRKNNDFYVRIKRIYAITIGLHWLKKLYLKEIGLSNGKRRIKLLSAKEGDKLICRKIKSNEPFMFARYGSTEFRNITGDKDFDLLYFYSGFFPKDKSLLGKFRKVYADSSKSIDLLVAWNYLNHFMKKVRLMKRLPNVKYLLPGQVTTNNSEWLKELEGKKVLVIHPFKTTIEQQYGQMDKLKILPKLKKLEVIRAVQTLAGNEDDRFETWFDALEYMKKEIDKKDFDIALIGCGAYGMPLAAHVKSLGKQAMHLGGGLQLLFGIRGKRFDNYGIYNKYWVSPGEKDFIKNYKKIEGGCYW